MVGEAEPELGNVYWPTWAGGGPPDGTFCSGGAGDRPKVFFCTGGPIRRKNNWHVPFYAVSQDPAAGGERGGGEPNLAGLGKALGATLGSLQKKWKKPLGRF